MIAALSLSVAGAVAVAVAAELHFDVQYKIASFSKCTFLQRYVPLERLGHGPWRLCTLFLSLSLSLSLCLSAGVLPLSFFFTGYYRLFPVVRRCILFFLGGRLCLF